MASRTYLIIFVAISHWLLLSSANFVSQPSNPADLRAALKNSFSLICDYTGDGDAEFVDWYKDGKSVTDPLLEKRLHYEVKHTEKSSNLTIRIFVHNDSVVNHWYVTSKKSTKRDSIACEFGQIKAIPSPQRLLTNREDERVESKQESIRRVEDESVTLQCVIKPPIQQGDGSTALQWEYNADDKSDNFEPISLDGVQVNGDTLTIDQVKKTHRGHYRCTTNGVSFSVLLRVKDRFAALWPFLGIVGVVLVLVIVILIAERRQKTTRRTMGNDEDENDHANDPLVRSANRASDNDNKKRAVRA